MKDKIDSNMTVVSGLAVPAFAFAVAGLAPALPFQSSPSLHRLRKDIRDLELW